jgi:hypothetical protein
LERHNKPVKSLDAKILKAPIRICNACNSARTQPHDRAWEEMSDRLRNRPLVIGRWVRANRLFSYDTRRQMIKVHLFFLKLFGCMLCEAKANGHDVPIDIAPFSEAIVTGRPHPEVHLQFGKCDGTVGRRTCIAGRRSTTAFWPVGSMNSTPSPSALFTRRRDGGSIARTYGIRALIRVPNASRSQTLGICAA